MWFRQAAGGLQRWNLITWGERMADEKLDRVLRTVEPGRRAMLKKMVLAAAFTIPVVASFPVSNLANANIGSMGTTTTSFKTSTL
jgi:hypothetical protein